MEITDPVCKMTIEEVEATGTSSHGGVTYYFCSNACKEKFDKNPDAYISGRGVLQYAPTDSGRDKKTAGGETFTFPNASGNTAERSRRLSEVRHGA